MLVRRLAPALLTALLAASAHAAPPARTAAPAAPTPARAVAPPPPKPRAVARPTPSEATRGRAKVTPPASAIVQHASERELDDLARPDAHGADALAARGYDRVARELRRPTGTPPSPGDLAEAAARWVTEARALGAAPSSAFEVAAAGGNVAQAARTLREASLLLKIASHLETEPAAKTELAARASALYAEAGAAHAPAAETATLSSRDRRLLQAVEDLRAHGFEVDIRRTEADAFFQPPLGGTKRVVVRFAHVEQGAVASSAEDVLRHELQHLHDWAHGKLGGVAVEADVARQEIRANYAATKDVAKAVTQTRDLYRFTGPYLDGLREGVVAERRATGRPLDDAAVDSEVFRRSVRWSGWPRQDEVPLRRP